MKNQKLLQQYIKLFLELPLLPVVLLEQVGLVVVLLLLVLLLLYFQHLSLY